MKKSIYSWPALREAMRAANRRYREFLSTLDDPTAGVARLRKVTETLRENQRSYPGFHFFSAADQTLFGALARGEFNLQGLQNKTLREHLSPQTSRQISRLRKRLRLHGFIKKVGRSYRYYLTPFGKHAITTGLKLQQLVLIPQLAAMPSQ